MSYLLTKVSIVVFKYKNMDHMYTLRHWGLLLSGLLGQFLVNNSLNNCVSVTVLGLFWKWLFGFLLSTTLFNSGNSIFEKTVFFKGSRFYRIEISAVLKFLDSDLVCRSFLVLSASFRPDNCALSKDLSFWLFVRRGFRSVSHPDRLNSTSQEVSNKFWILRS